MPFAAPARYDAKKEDAVIELTEDQRQELSPPDPSAALEETFRALADEWRAETDMHSSMSK